MLRGPGTKLPSEGLLEKELFRAHASDVTKIWSAVSCKAFKLPNINVLFAGLMRRYWGSRPNCPPIEFSESATGEPLA